MGLCLVEEVGVGGERDVRICVSDLAGEEDDVEPVLRSAARLSGSRMAIGWGLQCVASRRVRGAQVTPPTPSNGTGRAGCVTTTANHGPLSPAVAFRVARDASRAVIAWSASCRVRVLLVAAVKRRRLIRLVATLRLPGACTAYILWKIDLGRTAHILGDARMGYLLLSIALTTVAVLPMTWRWRELLRARGVSEGFGWLLRAYFVSYTAGQVLPTSLR